MLLKKIWKNMSPILAKIAFNGILPAEIKCYLNKSNSHYKIHKNCLSCMSI